MVGIADPEELMERAREETSGTAKVWFNAQRTQLFVTDTPDRQALFATLVQSMQRPPKICKLHVRYSQFVTLPNAPAVGASAGERGGLTGMRSNPFGPGKIRFGEGPAANPEPGNETTVSVPSGKGAWLMVSPDAPRAGWLFQWGLGRNYWTATPWRQTKTFLYVEVKIRERIRLRLMPAVGYTVGNLQRNVALDSLAAEKTVENGEELEVGTIFGNGEEFFQSFLLSYDRNRQAQPVQIWLTPQAP